MSALSYWRISHKERDSAGWNWCLWLSAQGWLDLWVFHYPSFLFAQPILTAQTAAITRCNCYQVLPSLARNFDSLLFPIFFKRFYFCPSSCSTLWVVLQSKHWLGHCDTFCCVWDDFTANGLLWSKIQLSTDDLCVVKPHKVVSMLLWFFIGLFYFSSATCNCFNGGYVHLASLDAQC